MIPEESNGAQNDFHLAVSFASDRDGPMLIDCGGLKWLIRD